MKVKLLEPIEGYEEIAEYKEVDMGDPCVTTLGDEYEALHHHVGLVLTPIKKILDWNKISDGVHIRHDDGIGGLDILMAHNVFDDLPKNIKKLYSIPPSWMAHTLGDKCPIDPDACIVEVKYYDKMMQTQLARNISWGIVCHFRVTGLAEGYEYP